MGKDLGNIVVHEESERKNAFISSLLYSRATVFHPSLTLTSFMKKKLVEVAENGGTTFDTPLGTSIISSYGNSYRVDLYVDYLLQGHRDLLDTLLAYATKITLDKKSREQGLPFTWSSVLKTISGIEVVSENHPYNIIDDQSSIVLSMSMYELAIRMGLTPHRTNYKKIEDRIAKLFAVFLTVSQIDDDGSLMDRKPLRFIKDFRVCYDPSKNKNGKNKGNAVANHVFVILERSLLKSIKDHGFFLREEQFLMANYSQPSIRSFLKYLKTHKKQFASGKKLDWMMEQYIQSMASPVGINFRTSLKKLILDSEMMKQIENDFYIQIRMKEDGQLYLYYIGTIEEEK
ncbi:DNA mismatch repair protein [Vibrio pectenicida]|uniref:DNA mismatch repair protein n=1 Tax=Vibrio pectenicida TaxID=62763 RepID=A0A3R9EBU8_9VIBR|nr:DNA mismatch repair protein [Vibrio pectenicida]RSD30474.1 DNA mismatch repair protein [Vibrio pectenicida]